MKKARIDQSTTYLHNSMISQNLLNNLDVLFIILESLVPLSTVGCTGAYFLLRKSNGPFHCILKNSLMSNVPAPFRYLFKISAVHLSLVSLAILPARSISILPLDTSLALRVLSQEVIPRKTFSYVCPTDCFWELIFENVILSIVFQISNKTLSVVSLSRTSVNSKHFPYPCLCK